MESIRPLKAERIATWVSDLCCGYYSEEGFLAFLKDKLAIEGYS